MKSRIFSFFDESTKDRFKSEIEKLISLPDKSLKRLPKYVVQLEKILTSHELRTALEKRATIVGVTPAHLHSAFQISKFFLKGFLSTGEARTDSPNDMVEDMEELGLIKSESKKKLVGFLTHMKELVSEQVEVDMRKISAASATLPCLTNIATAVNYRVVFEKQFVEDKGVEGYNPRCYGVVPVATVLLNFDIGPAKNVCFQAERKALKSLIEVLQATDKEFEIADKYLNLESV